MEDCITPPKPIHTTVTAPDNLQGYSCSWPPALERRIERCKAEYNQFRMAATNNLVLAGSVHRPALTGRIVKPLIATKPDNSPKKDPGDTTALPRTKLKPIHRRQMAADANDPQDQTFTWLTNSESLKLIRSISHDSPVKPFP